MMIVPSWQCHDDFIRKEERPVIGIRKFLTEIIIEDGEICNLTQETIELVNGVERGEPDRLYGQAEYG